jgi:hypothetical protein
MLAKQYVRGNSPIEIDVTIYLEEIDKERAK